MRMRKTLLSSFFILFFACVGALTAYAYDAWDGTITMPAGPTYTITSAAELAGIANAAQTNNFAGATISLEEDIDLAGHKWTPIGSAATPFKGTFKGNGHLVRGFRTFDATDGVGLFGHVADGAVIEQVGISGGAIIAPQAKRVGALAGVCAGTISQCWSMAQIITAGNIIGGLVGDLEPSGQLTDVYTAGLLLAHNVTGKDTIGALVGRNQGSITRAYSIGYAKNGNGFVGADKNGTYSKCYYDRKLYYQPSGLTQNDPELKPMDKTVEMFKIFKDETATWTTSDGLYPQLSIFTSVTTSYPASVLSVAPMFIDVQNEEPINHANKLTKGFKILAQTGGITWACQNDADTNWIQIDNVLDTIIIVRPCQETDVLVNKTFSGETHVVLMRPVRAKDLVPGHFTNASDTIDEFCQDIPEKLFDYLRLEEGEGGLEEHKYHYKVELYKITETSTPGVNDTTYYKTVFSDHDDINNKDTVNKDGYPIWCDSVEVPTKEPGNFLLRSFIHDEGCVLDWLACPDTFRFVVYPKFTPGKIESGKDSTLLPVNPPVAVSSLLATTGGKGTIGYQWEVNGDSIDDAESMSPYDITEKGEYHFLRSSYDELCHNKMSQQPDTGEYILWVFDPFDPGEVVDEGELSFCTVTEAQTLLIEGTAASGAVEDKGYSYKWYMQDGTAAPTLISGATGQDLDLSTVTLTAGHDYIFTRQAWDNTRLTNWTDSRYSQTIHIAAEFVAGTVTTKIDTVLLVNGKATANYSNTTPSTGGSGTIHYKWEMNGAEIGQTGQNLANYEITEAGTYIFTRYSFDDKCHPESDHVADNGQYTLYVFDAFDPGEVDNDILVFCTLNEAKAHTVSGSSASGAVEDKGYQYKWFINSGSGAQAISGATSQNLSLSDVELEAGKTYVFTRQAKDNTRFTNWEDSRLQQTIKIMAVLKPGAINDGTLKKECVAYDADGTTTLTVSISETKASSGDPDREFRWIRMPDGAIVGDQEELSYTFSISEISLGTTYTYTREVRNPGCEWQQSEGSMTQYIGRSIYEEKTIIVCDEDMPYTMEWFSADGIRRTYTFNNATDTWLTTDNSFDCPHDTLFKIDVVKVPSLTIESHASFCQSTGSITLYFTQTEELSDIFHITYSDDLAKYMGVKDTTGIMTAPGTIVLNNVPSIGTGDIYLLVQIGYSDGTGEGLCFSRSQKMDLYVSLGGYVHSKYDRVLFVDNNPENGIDVGTAEKLEFKAYQWYKNGVAQEGQTGQYYHEDGKQLNGVYYVLLTDTKDRQYRSCDVVMPAETASNAPQNSAVYPVPANVGQPLTIEGNGAAQIISSAGECLTRFEVNGQTTVSAPRVAGMYYVQVTNADGELEMHKLIVK